MDKRIKVAFINYSLFAGGAERNVINLSNYFQKKGINTDILIFKNINEYKGEYKNNGGGSLRIVPLLNTQIKIPTVLKPFFIFRLLYQLYTVILRNKYDILIAAEEYDPFFITILFSKLTRIKSLLLVGNNISKEIRTKGFILKIVYTIVFSISFHLSNHIICTSKQLRLSLVKEYSIPKNKITYIYNAVNREMIKQKMRVGISNAEQKYFQKGKTLITLGRLVYKKGFCNLIRAFSLVQKSVPEAKLIIIGKGPLENRLNKLISTLNLTKSVLLFGFEKKNPYRLLFKADIFMFTSLYEGFGNVILEAMNCGLPIISSDCPYGPKEIIRNKYGVLFPSFSPNDNIYTQHQKEAFLAKIILRVLSNKIRVNKLKKASINRSQSFSLDIMGRKYLDTIYRLTL